MHGFARAAAGCVGTDQYAPSCIPIPFAHRGRGRSPALHGAIWPTLNGRVEAAEADALAAGLPPNPTLGYSRDRGRRGADATEETWQIAQAFDVSGRRGLRREAADLRVEAA
jgi:hypothetical protein